MSIWTGQFCSCVRPSTTRWILEPSSNPPSPTSPSAPPPPHLSWMSCTVGQFLVMTGQLRGECMFQRFLSKMSLKKIHHCTTEHSFDHCQCHCHYRCRCHGHCQCHCYCHCYCQWRKLLFLYLCWFLRWCWCWNNIEIKCLQYLTPKIQPPIFS